MPFFRNFTWYIDKRNWKYFFLMLSLELSNGWELKSESSILNSQFIIHNS